LFRLWERILPEGGLFLSLFLSFWNAKFLFLLSKIPQVSVLCAEIEKKTEHFLKRGYHFSPDVL